MEQFLARLAVFIIIIGGVMVLSDNKKPSKLYFGFIWGCLILEMIDKIK